MLPNITRRSALKTTISALLASLVSPGESAIRIFKTAKYNFSSQNLQGSLFEWLQNYSGNYNKINQVVENILNSLNEDIPLTKKQAQYLLESQLYLYEAEGTGPFKNIFEQLYNGIMSDLIEKSKKIDPKNGTKSLFSLLKQNKTFDYKDAFSFFNELSHEMPVETILSSVMPAGDLIIDNKIILKAEQIKQLGIMKDSNIALKNLKKIFDDTTENVNNDLLSKVYSISIEYAPMDYKGGIDPDTQKLAVDNYNTTINKENSLIFERYKQLHQRAFISSK
jgi:hypothetical protein